MKSLLAGTFTVLLSFAISFAQDTTTAPANGAKQEQANPAAQTTKSNMKPAQTPRIAAGSVIPVQLTKSIDAKKVKTGDPVEATVTEDMKENNGTVLLPRDTKVVGHVTETQERNKEQKQSEVGIAFDSTVTKNGDATTLPMSIQAVIAKSYLNPANSGGSPDTAQQSSASGGGMSPNTAGRPGTMGTGAAPSAGSAPGAEDASTTQSQAHAPITANTKGVLGMQNVNLSAAADTAKGSVISSDKSNVKLEGGTLMLLRVAQ